MTKEQLVFSVHPENTIYKRGDGKRFFTKYREEGDSNNEPKTISCVTRSGLINKLYDLYFDSKKVITLSDLYPAWMEKRKKDSLDFPDELDMKTVKRNDEHWHKYIEWHEISRIPIKKIDTKTLLEYFVLVVKKYKMTRKELGNMKFIIRKLFSLAVDEEIIKTNPYISVDFNDDEIKCRSKKKKSDGSRVYLDNEAKKLLIFLENEKSIFSLAIQLAFELGTRKGELLALKWTDINNGEITIERMEHKKIELDENYKIISSTFEIVDHVKGDSDHGYRPIYLTDKALHILKTIASEYIKDNEEYIFNYKGTQLDSNAFDYHLVDLCKKAGVKYKSSHNIRRTTASVWDNARVPTDEIRRMLGHADIATTQGYIYNTKSKEEVIELMNQARKL